MTRREFGELLKSITLYYPDFKIPDESIVHWYNKMFFCYPFQECMDAVDRYAADNRYPPHLSDIRKIAKDIYLERKEVQELKAIFGEDYEC